MAGKTDFRILTCKCLKSPIGLNMAKQRVNPQILSCGASLHPQLVSFCIHYIVGFIGNYANFLPVLPFQSSPKFSKDLPFHLISRYITVPISLIFGWIQDLNSVHCTILRLQNKYSAISIAKIEDTYFWRWYQMNQIYWEWNMVNSGKRDGN